MFVFYISLLNGNERQIICFWCKINIRYITYYICHNTSKRYTYNFGYLNNRSLYFYINFIVTLIPWWWPAKVSISEKVLFVVQPENDMTQNAKLDQSPSCDNHLFATNYIENKLLVWYFFNYFYHYKIQRYEINVLTIQRYYSIPTS